MNIPFLIQNGTIIIRLLLLKLKWKKGKVNSYLSLLKMIKKKWKSYVSKNYMC